MFYQQTAFKIGFLVVFALLIYTIKSGKITEFPLVSMLIATASLMLLILLLRSFTAENKFGRPNWFKLLISIGLDYFQMALVFLNSIILTFYCISLEIDFPVGSITALVFVSWGAFIGSIVGEIFDWVFFVLS